MPRAAKPEPSEEIQKEFWKGVANKLGMKYIASYKDETVTVANPADSRQQQLHAWFLRSIGVIK